MSDTIKLNNYKITNIEAATTADDSEFLICLEPDAEPKDFIFPKKLVDKYSNIYIGE